jgi:hypothetical protein
LAQSFSPPKARLAAGLLYLGLPFFIFGPAFRRVFASIDPSMPRDRGFSWRFVSRSRFARKCATAKRVRLAPIGIEGGATKGRAFES